MNPSKMLFSVIFAIMIIVWVACVVVTVFPDSNASKNCYLGYKAHCSFTPFGTIISVTAAFATFFIGRNLGYLNF